MSDHVRSLDTAAAHAAATAERHEETPPDYDEWQEHAVDSRDDPE